MLEGIGVSERLSEAICLIKHFELFQMETEGCITSEMLKIEPLKDVIVAIGDLSSE